MGSRHVTLLTATTAAVSLLLLALGAGAAWYAHRLQKGSSELLAINVASVRAAEELEIAVRDIRSRLDQYLITADPRHLAAIPDLRRRAELWLAEAERVATTPQEAEWMRLVRRGCEHFFAELARATGGGPAGTPARLHDRLDRILAEEIIAPAHAYLDFNEEALDRISRSNRDLAGRLVLGFLLLGAGGAGAGLVAGVGLAGALRRSIGQVHVPLRHVAGQLGAVVGPLPAVAGDDLGSLEAAVRQLAEPVGELVRRLHRSQKEALRAEQLALVGQMAAGVAHEVRNPLTAIKVLVQGALERGEAGAIRGRPLRVLEEEVVRLERLTSAFLDFARPPRPAKRPADLRPVVAETLELVARRAALQSVRLRPELPPAPAVADVDPGQLRQVLLNLFLNALEASPVGGSVRVELAAGPGAVELRVADEGPGPPEGLGERIFEPFVSTKETGVGLGLSICRRVVEAHGGTLTAARGPAGGAVFTVALPPPGEREAKAWRAC